MTLCTVFGGVGGMDFFGLAGQDNLRVLKTGAWKMTYLQPAQM